MKGPTLPISSGTNAVTLQNFLSSVDKHAKLRAKTENGETVLYASTKPSGLFSRLPGRASEKREAAKEVLENTLGKLAKGAIDKASTGALRQEAETAFNETRLTLFARGDSGVNVGMARLALLAATNKAKDVALRSKETENLPIAKLGKLDAAYAKAAGELNAGKPADAAKTLADAIAAAGKKNLSLAEKDALAFSAGNSLRSTIADNLQKAVGLGFDTLLPPGKERDDFLRDVTSSALARVHDDRQIDPKTIEVGGKQYTIGKQIGQGGFAEVFLCETVNAPKEYIALKLTTKTQSDTPETIDARLQTLGKEVAMHRLATQGKPENIIDLKGAFRTADGRIGIAMTAAPNGTVHEAMSKLNDALQKKLISPQAAQAARLTLLQDMAKGLLALEKAGIVDGDFKPPNVLIDGDGIAKITDFGTAQKTNDYLLSQSEAVDNPIWLAPEVLKGKSTVNDITNHQSPEFADRAKEVDADIRKAFGISPTVKKLPNALKLLIKDIFSPETSVAANKVSVGNKGDVWALGVAAFNLLYGQDSLVAVSYSSVIFDKIEAFGNDPNNRAIGPKGTKGAFVEPKGYGAEEDLINQLLHPVPDERPTMAQVLKHPAFGAPGVGSTAARDLIKALTKDPMDVAGLKKASDDMAPPSAALL